MDTFPAPFQLAWPWDWFRPVDAEKKRCESLLDQSNEEPAPDSPGHASRWQSCVGIGATWVAELFYVGQWPGELLRFPANFARAGNKPLLGLASERDCLLVKQGLCYTD